MVRGEYMTAYLKVAVTEAPTANIAKSLIKYHDMSRTCNLTLLSSQHLIVGVVLVSSVCGHVICKLLPEHDPLSFPIIPFIHPSVKSSYFTILAHFNLVILWIDLPSRNSVFSFVLVKLNIGTRNWDNLVSVHIRFVGPVL